MSDDEVDAINSRPQQVRTAYVRPPIPTKKFDWTAWFDGHEEATSAYGETEEQAIDQLLEDAAEAGVDVTPYRVVAKPTIKNLLSEVARLKAELADARKDTVRLDWLSTTGFSTIDEVGGSPRVHSWRETKERTTYEELAYWCPGMPFRWRWTAQTIGSEYETSREAIDAAIDAAGEK